MFDVSVGRVEPVPLRLFSALQSSRRLGGAEGVPRGRQEGGQGQWPGIRGYWIPLERRGGTETSTRRDRTTTGPPSRHPRQHSGRRRGRYADPCRRIGLQV